MLTPPPFTERGSGGEVLKRSSQGSLGVPATLWRGAQGFFAVFYCGNGSGSPAIAVNWSKRSTAPDPGAPTLLTAT